MSRNEHLRDNTLHQGYEPDTVILLSTAIGTLPINSTLHAWLVAFDAELTLLESAGHSVLAFSASSVLFKTQSNTKTADAILRVNRAASTNVDAILRVAQTASLTANAIQFATLPGSLNANAFVTDGNPYFFIDSVLLRVVSSSFSANAVVIGSAGSSAFQSDTFQADSFG